ncbi:hypothetical protein Q8A73_012328 [Channa argus]|nr:hypothetical protein Q8A73_012328 [Channa argus]
MTKVKGLTHDGFPAGLTLEPGFAALFGVKCNLRTGPRPAPPSRKDALTGRLADRFFVIANAISELALLPDALPDKYAEEISKFSSAILAMCAPIAFASARISALANHDREEPLMVCLVPIFSTLLKRCRRLQKKRIRLVATSRRPPALPDTRFLTGSLPLHQQQPLGDLLPYTPLLHLGSIKSQIFQASQVGLFMVSPSALGGAPAWLFGCGWGFPDGQPAPPSSPSQRAPHGRRRGPNWRLPCVLDKWMDRIIRNGYSLQFATAPPSFAGILETQLSSPAHMTALASELSDLLGKRAISVVPPMEETQGFYPRYFLVPKKSGEMRPILDLSFLNQLMVIHRFHMLTTASVFRSVRQGDWLSSVDLKGAYFQIPIAMQHRKFLRFSFLGVRYQYSCLPFGYSLAPRTFSKCLETGLVPLRAAGMRVALLQMVDLVTHLSSLGFTINWRKSSPLPAQSIIFLGVELDVPILRARLSQERRETLLAMLHRLTPGRVVTAHSVMRLLGMMAAALSVVPFGLLHMTRLQRDPVCHRRRLVMIPPSVGPDLANWRGPRVMLDGVPLGPPSSYVSVFTDASLMGWGGTCLSQSVGTPWPEGMSCHVPVHTDNTTTDSYINHQGGVRSAPQHRQETAAVGPLASPLHQSCVHPRRSEHSRGHYVSGARPREWVLHTELVQEVWSRFGRAEVDLFAAKGNAQCPLWFSLRARDFPPLWGGCILPLALAQAAPLCFSACPSDSQVAGPRERVSHRHPCGPKASGGTVVPGTLPDACRPALGAPMACGRTLVDRGFSLNTVKTYAAAISSCPEGFADRSVFSHPLLKRFLRGVRWQRPLAPPWDLSLVLCALVASPFEPLDQVPLRLLSWKTALLLALTSMKRVSDLSALSVSPECLSVRGDLSLAVLRPNPAFMPKCITSSFRSRVITLEGFFTPPHTSEEHASSHLLCPVRALSYYVERTSTIRRSERLFVHYREGFAGLPLSAQRLCHWLCEAIFQAYESAEAQTPEVIRAHSTRGIASSVSLLRGVSVEDICSVYCS